MIDVHKLASEYEFRGDAGDYTPTEAERHAPRFWRFLASSMPRSTTRWEAGRRWNRLTSTISHRRTAGLTPTN